MAGELGRDAGEDVGDGVGLTEHESRGEQRGVREGAGGRTRRCHDRDAVPTAATQKIEEPLRSSAAGHRRERVERSLEVVDDEQAG